MAKIDKTYHDLLNKILNDGFKYEDPNRKGVHRLQIPNYQFIHDFKDGFPAITTKKLFWKGVVGELLWFLRGETSIKYLLNNNISIWNKDAYNYYLKQIGKNNEGKYYLEPMGMNTFLERIKDNKKYEKSRVESLNYKLGDLGRVYGAQWRDWRGLDGKGFGDRVFIDQITNLIKGLKENPMGTRHIVTAWNPAELDEMALPPCHWSFEILVEPRTFEEKMIESRKKDDFNQPQYQFTLKWHQRSVDTFLGLPFNIASYALLAHIIGKITNMVPKAIIGDLSNVHIYEPHMNAVKEQLSKDVNKYDKCELEIDLLTSKLLGRGFTLNKVLDILEISDFKLPDYNSYPPIKAEMLPYNK